MAEATIQSVTTSLSGEEPFIGDLSEGEVCVNVADGRIWSGDSEGVPIELGGAVKNSPMGNLLTSNYLDVDVTLSSNLPISNTNPMNVPPGFYRSHKILIRFTQVPLENFNTYFDYPVNWGEEAFWKPDIRRFTWGGITDLLNIDADNPIDLYKAQGRSILVELSSFGPNPEWIGQVLWVNTL